jgi:H+-transporting ATPase
VKPAPLPDKWNFREIFLLAFLLGMWQVISTVTLFVIIKETTFFTDKIGLHHLTNSQLRGLIYLQVSVSGQVRRSGDGERGNRS